MSWKDRAEKVETNKSSWRDRAEPVDERSPLEVAKDALNPMNWPKNAMAGIEALDSVTGAPVRKFVTETITRQDLDKAPSGKEQAEMLGISAMPYGEALDLEEGSLLRKAADVTSPAGVVGMGLDIIQDPLNYATFGAAAIGKRLPQIKDILSRGAASGKESLKASGLAEDIAEAAISSNPTTAAIIGDKSANVFNNLPTPLADLTTPDQMRRMREIEFVLPDFPLPPQNIHYEMLKGEKRARELKNKIDQLSPKEVEAFRNYNQGMFGEASTRIVATPEQISGTPLKGLPETGDSVISTIRDLYQSERNRLGPMFEELKINSTPLTPDETKDMAIAIMENTKSPGLFELVDGRVTLGKNLPRFGISDQEHKVLKNIIEDLNDGATFEEIQRIREFMRKSIDPSNPKAFAALGEARKIMLDYLEGMVMGASDVQSNKVQSVFRQFAQNERNKDMLESIIGGSIDSLDAIYKANPEKVVGRILSNPNYTAAFRNYVGQDKLNEIIGAYIQDGILKSTHSTRGFEPHRFQNWLKRNEQVLAQNLPAEELERLSAMSDLAWMSKRFMDLANPSGTADALGAKGLIDALTTGGLSGAGGKLMQGGKDIINRRGIRKEIRGVMNQPKPTPQAPESVIERAKRINLERKLQRGGN